MNITGKVLLLNPRLLEWWWKCVEERPTPKTAHLHGVTMWLTDEVDNWQLVQLEYERPETEGEQ